MWPKKVGLFHLFYTELVVQLTESNNQRAIWVLSTGCLRHTRLNREKGTPLKFKFN